MPIMSNDISAKALVIGVFLSMLLAVLLQLVVFHVGFVSASADESARALIAWDLTWRDLFIPEIWPPFYEFAVGLVLKAYPDLFYAPRMLSMLFGLLTIGALALLAREMFRSNLVALLSAFLAVFLHHRLLLSIAPMSEIFFNFFIVLGSCALARFARRDSAIAFVVAAAMFFLAATVRFEGWFICVAFAVISFIVQVRSRPIGWAHFFLGIVVAAAFPMVWSGLSIYHFGDLSGITAARDQNHSANVSLVGIVRRSHASAFIRDVVTGPLVLGVAAGLVVGWRSRPARFVLLVAIAGLVFASLAAIATQSSPLAAPWRIAGAWTTLVVPFTAYALVRLASHVEHHLQRKALIILSIASVCLMSIPSWQIVRRTTASEFGFDADILSLRTELSSAIDNNGAKVLIDVDDVYFLDLVVAINRPDAMIYSTGDDPIAIALHIGQKEFWETSTTETGRQIYEQYISVKTGPNAEKATLIAQDIRFVLLQRPGDRQNTDVAPHLERVGRFGSWSLYKLL